MGEIKPLHETPPRFIIDESANEEQHGFLESFQSNIINDPEIYLDSLKKHSSLTEETKRPNDILSDVLEYTNGSPKRTRALYDLHQFFHGALNAARYLIDFDEATLSRIHQNPESRNLSGKLKAARREGSSQPRMDALTNDLRRLRIGTFIQRALEASRAAPPQGQSRSAANKAV